MIYSSMRETFLVDWQGLRCDTRPDDWSMKDGRFVFDDLLVPIYDRRAYHNLSHVFRCRQELDDLSTKMDISDVLLAIWFHDIIYSPVQSNNEALSASIANLAMAAAHADLDQRNRIQRLILATDHQGKPEDAQEQIICDADMSILGAEPDEYEKYRKGIAAEYSMTSVVPRDFVRGRVEFLEHLRGPIFHTNYFRDKFEDKARENIRAELSLLYKLLDPESMKACQYYALM